MNKSGPQNLDIHATLDSGEENPLRMGISTLDELEEMIKAFRSMNQTALKKRYILSREPVKNPSTGQILLDAKQEVDLATVRLMRRHYPGDHTIKTFQPDEGIVIVSDMTVPEGITLSVDMVTQVMNLGGGAYEGFIDRVDTFYDLLNMIKRQLFPRLILVGYLPPDRLEMERINFIRTRRFDQYVRVIELTHSSKKYRPYFPNLKQVRIEETDNRSWGRFILEVIREYTKPYFVEEL